MKPMIKPNRTGEQRAEEEAIRRQHAANPVRQRPAGTINQQSRSNILLDFFEMVVGKCAFLVSCH